LGLEIKGEEDVEQIGCSFWKREDGQDVVEYALLMAFVCLAGAAFFVSMRGETSTIWQNVNTHLAAANTSN
jgi:Flp pilus assembly pilin Flp